MSLEGSKSTVYGSLKSSRSSTTIFGSCISTDTIGSFHTAKSCAIGSSTQTIGSFHTARSCSTLYFSAKEEDSNTLNWTMNYGSFDELSDTSTLVGDHEEHGDVSEVASVTSASEIRMDIKHSPEAESEEAHILMEEDDGCSTSTQIIDPIIEELAYVEVATYNERKLSGKFGHFQKALNSKLHEMQDFFVIVLVSVLSVAQMSVNSVDISLDNPSSWSLVFWRALIQIAISIPFMFWFHGKGFVCQEGGQCVPVISGILVSVSTICWLCLDHHELLTSEMASIFYFSMPIVIFLMESFTRRSPFSVAMSIMLFLFWNAGVLAYSSQFWSSKSNSDLWLLKGHDLIFAWPISNLIVEVETNEFLGIFLAIIGGFTMSAAMVVTSIGKAAQWPSFLAWQGLGGLIASFIGFVSMREYPEWSSRCWWYPLMTSLFGFAINALIVMVLLKSDQKRPFSNSSVVVAVIKASLEAFVLFFVSFSSVQKEPGNWTAILSFVICLLIVMISLANKR